MDQEYNETLPAYGANVEVFIALRDVDYHYSMYENMPVKSSRKTIARKVVAYWKPPGALQWVEKCVTETVFREKSPKFATKLYFQCEARDAPAISIKFDVHDLLRQEAQHSALLGSVEVTLESLINASSGGLELPIFSLIEPYKSKRGRSRIDTGRLFLRAELLKPMDYAVLLKFGLRMGSPKCCICIRPPLFPYYFEIYKLNEQTLFEISYPYTLIHRSELIKHSGAEDDCWNYIVLPVSRVCNGDMGRVLKLAVYQADHPNVPKGFALTTLRKILIERELVIPVNRLDGKVSQKLCLYAPLCHEVPLHPFQYYINKGLNIRRIYAADYSSSNWNIQLHRRSLHDIDVGRTPYEEAMIMAASAMIDIAQGESVFFSFGNVQMEPYVASFGNENNVRSLLGSYKDALHGAKMSENTRPDGGTQLSSIQCVPTGKSGANPITNLTPLLNDIAALVSVRTESFEYHIVFIFTDGQISDLEQSMQGIVSLAKLPVSLIFIGIGMGDLNQLLTLEKEWIHPQTGEYPCRRIVHVIHFRSLLEWDSSIRFSHFRSNPPELFRKEIFTVIRDQMPAYMRIFQTAI